MVNQSDLGSDTYGYAAQLETLRSTAKWLIAAPAAVGALLAAGLQLTGVGRLALDSWRLYVALGAAVITLLSIGYVIKVASEVLTREWLTLAAFTDEATGLPQSWGKRIDVTTLRAIENRLMFSRHELFGHAAVTLAELHRLLQDSNKVLWRPDLDMAARREAAERSNELRQVARTVVQAANYYHVLHLFQQLRVRLAWAGVVGLVGLAVFAYALNPP